MDDEYRITIHVQMTPKRIKEYANDIVESLGLRDELLTLQVEEETDGTWIPLAVECLIED